MTTAGENLMLQEDQSPEAGDENQLGRVRSHGTLWFRTHLRPPVFISFSSLEIHRRQL